MMGRQDQGTSESLGSPVKTSELSSLGWNMYEGECPGYSLLVLQIYSLLLSDSLYAQSLTSIECITQALFPVSQLSVATKCW